MKKELAMINLSFVKLAHKLQVDAPIMQSLLHNLGVHSAMAHAVVPETKHSALRTPNDPSLGPHDPRDRVLVFDLPSLNKPTEIHRPSWCGCLEHVIL